MTKTAATRGLAPRVGAVRQFNRFFTRQIGLLDEGLLNSPFSLTEARILYELAHRERPSAMELCRDLGLDAGYLSRILRQFRKRGLVAQRPSDADGRRNLLELTSSGKAAFAKLDARSGQDIGALLRGLPEGEQDRLVGAMLVIERLLGGAPASPTPYLLRPPHPGDFGWVIHRHGALYAQEYGWDERFEALVATIVAGFVEKYDPKKERCFIAERDGEIVGSVFLVKKSALVAQLRLLFVEPRARGLGIGSRLVSECIGFARQSGYRKVFLWTNSILESARHLYLREGFRRTSQERHRSYGHDLVGETWELSLGQAASPSP
jgi:DNA-binding MarR family transcriptional regulator/N-acetylglutamate synthase-like GNAT family acetyltransferase